MLTGNNRIRSDVLDEALDERMAPSLGGVVLGKEHEMYVNPEQFFQRTLITEQMANILGNLVNVLKGESGKKILVLNALYGGGKTHTLLTIYHALKAPHTLLKAAPENEEVRKRVGRFIEEIGKLSKPDIIVIDGYFSELAPSPISPLDIKAYKVRTLWGYIAHTLGNYSIMREHDERQVAPEADRLLKLFENRSVIILIDELAHYIKRFYETPDENLRRYSSAIESFMEVLAPTLELSKKVILIISLPVIEKEREVIVETTYQAIRQTLEKAFKALKRVFTEYIEPIAPRNIPTLLRTRLFEEIDSRRARDVQDIFYKTYGENKEIFGEQVAATGEIPRTYPFHPLYISTLLDILDKHEGLQKTRDLLRISRKVLREALSDKRPYDIIMPWHIDLTKDPIRNALLIGEYEGFKPVIEEDINERAKLFGEKHALARITALALLAKTFVYGGGLIIPKIEVLPLEKDLAQMVYEPALFQSEGWAPKDIVDATRWISENLIYAVKDEKTGRLWFTRWVTPIKYVEERARKIEDLPALNKILEYSEKLLRETADSLMRRRVARTISPKVFDAELSRAYKICEPIDADARKYILLTYLEVPENYEDRRAKFEEIMYRTKSGGTRGYANTIYIAFPSSKSRVNYALEYAKKLIACEEVEREGIIDKLTGGLPVKEAEIAKEILKKKLEDYKTGTLQGLILNTLSIFDRIAYPHYDDERLTNTTKEVDFITQTDSIIVAAERSLASTGIGKIKTEMDFDTLDFYLRRINVDISEGTETKTVKAIIDFFYSNPRLPAVPKEVILDAIKDGVKRLKMGIRSRGKVFFKKVYEQEAPQISEGETIITLDEADEILPWKMALEEQMKNLKKKEFMEGRERRIEEYIVRLASREITTEEIIENIDKFDLEELRTAPLIKIIRTVSVKIELAKPLIEVNPGEVISLEARITRIGPYIGEVLLEPSSGNVDKERFTIDDTFTQEKVTWAIGNAPDKPGDYTYILKITDPKGLTLDETKLTVRVLGEKIGWKEGVPPGGLKLEEMELMSGEELSIKPLDILRRRISGAAIISRASFEISIETEDDRKSIISLNVQNVQIDDLLALTLTILKRFHLLKAAASLSINLKPFKKEYFIMPELTEEERKMLEEYKVRYLAFQAG